jgi:hypothetical protein
MSKKNKLFKATDLVPLSFFLLKTNNQSHFNLNHIKFVAVKKYKTNEFSTASAYRPISKLLS